MDAQPCGVDATVLASLAGRLTLLFEPPLRCCAAGPSGSVACVDRGMARFFPDFRRVVESSIEAVA
jgi:hypothetical protein